MQEIRTEGQWVAGREHTGLRGKQLQTGSLDFIQEHL